MTEKEARRRGCAAVAVLYALCAAATVWLVVALCGCSTTKYVPVETVRTEYKDRVREVQTVDSVTDTRFVWVSGDTVVSWRDRVKWRERVVRDTVSVIRTDTVREPYPVERKLTRWERTKMDFGGVALGGTALGVCALLAWLMIKMRRR